MIKFFVYFFPLCGVKIIRSVTRCCLSGKLRDLHKISTGKRLTNFSSPLIAARGGWGEKGLFYFCVRRKKADKMTH